MTSNPLRAARGTTASITARVLKDGEFAWNMDTDRLHLGDGSTYGGVVMGFLEDLQEAWLNVTRFGTFDGSADDYDAWLEAYNELPDEGGVLYLPYGRVSRVTDVFDWFGDGTSSVQSSKQNVWIIGGGGLPNGDLTTKKYAARIVYDGPDGAGQMIQPKGPMTCGVRGVALDCNLKAAGGIYATHAFRSRFEDLHVSNYRGSAYKIDAHLTHAQCTTGAVGNIWDNIYCDTPGDTTVTAFECGVQASAPGELDVARNIIKNFGFRTANNVNSNGILLSFCDIIQFENGLVHSGGNAAANNAKLLRVIAPTGNTTFPQAISFRNVAIIGDPQDDWAIDAGWTADPDDDSGILFLPFLKADIESAANDAPDHPMIYGVTDEGEWFGKLATAFKSATATPTVQVFTASGTYTKPAGLTSVIVEVRGAGGGGGGVSSTAGALAAAGGGQGGRAVKRIAAASIGSTETVTVGTGGTGGSTSGGNGSGGGTTSFGSHVSATGGNGGAGTTAAGMLAPGDGGAGSSGDINISGQGGLPGVGITGTGPASGAGGGEGGGRGRTTTGAGVAGNDGGGGGGAASAGSSTANAGGTGGNGYVIVTEFY